MGLYKPRGADEHLGEPAIDVGDPSRAMHRSSMITVMVSQNPGQDKRP